MADNIKLPEEIFSINVESHELVKLAYDSYLANARQSSATTKRRGEVSGGGKKPWRQKGTGRARVGSNRSPIWRGGGVTFGPLGNENYSKKLSTQAKRTAVKQALSLANKSKKIVVDEIKATGKTADVAKYLADKKLDRRVLLVVDEKTPALMRSTNNIQNVLVVSAKYLTVYHILNADHIVIWPSALPMITEWLSKEVKK